MTSTRRVPPVWLMGLSNATLGFANGITFFVMPQLMAAAHVPEWKIAAITAVATSPNFWVVLFGPILDVRFSRRWYATVLAALSSLGAMTAILGLRNLLVVEVAMVLCNAGSALSSFALGGWLSNITLEEKKNSLSKWMNIALVSGVGLIVATGGELIRRLPVVTAAALMGAIVFLPATIFLFMPAPGPDRRLASESFMQFNREVLSLLRRREVVIVLLLFLSPCSTFALPNLLGGLGADFHASARAVSLAGGVGAFIPGLLGCAVFPLIARRLRLRPFYLANAVVGCLFTLSLVILPHTPLVFALAVFGEFLFQAVSFSIQVGIMFEAIGPKNPLAATTFAFLAASTNIPVTYITLIDGKAYSFAGITGMLIADAAVAICTCVVAAIFLAKFDTTNSRVIEEPVALAQE